MKLGNFFAELKRRNVYKVAVAYAVVAWLVIQVSSTVLPTFHAPEWVVQTLVVLVALGFPIALVIAWAFEATPEGIKRTEVADAMPAAARQKKHAWIYIVVIGGGISVGLFFVGRYSAMRNAAPRPASAELRRGEQSEAAAVAPKSIAVLPFDNLSRDPDNAYFCEGVQDEILTRLAKVADLKVISRTSTQHFKSTPDNLPQIAKQLGVAHILEGSVQKAADQVRVNVQLINAASDAHLWAESFDRKLTDIFAVESDIAKTIADTLQAKLTGSEKISIAKVPTANTEAYELYLKGRFFWNKRTGADLKTGAEYFKQAIAKDPNYALAYAGLADCYVLFPGYGASTPQESYPLAKAAATKALELDGSLGEAHASLGQAIMFYDLDFQQSAAEFQRAITLSPNYATAHHWYGNGPPMITGDFETAIVELKRAQQLDPLSLIINADLGYVFFNARRYDEAIAQLRKTIAMDSHFYYAHWNLGMALEMKGDLKEAFTEYSKAAELNDDPLVAGLLARAYAKLGQRDQALQKLEQLKQAATHRYVENYAFAFAYAGFGEKDKAIDSLERAYHDHSDPEIIVIKVDPMLDSLRGEPRFDALVQKLFAKQ
jgi:TolB-like protein/Flp pilus assembly protein TadD